MRASFALLVAATLPLLSHAQRACSSDGQPQPLAVVDRFISADCATCWEERPALVPSPSTLVVDWILPTPQGDDAPLSAAATSDALHRLQALGRYAPVLTDTAVSPVQPRGSGPRPTRLRVAHGPAMNDYVGMGVRFVPAPDRASSASPTAPAPPAPWVFTFLLVEAVDAGSDGTPVARNLVRNTFTGEWTQASASPSHRHLRQTLAEQRSMRIPEGARPDRLRLVGWVQDGAGRIVAAAQSVCAP